MLSQALGELHSPRFRFITRDSAQTSSVFPLTASVKLSISLGFPHVAQFTGLPSLWSISSNVLHGPWNTLTGPRSSGSRLSGPTSQHTSSARTTAAGASWGRWMNFSWSAAYKGHTGSTRFSWWSGVLLDQWCGPFCFHWRYPGPRQVRKRLGQEFTPVAGKSASRKAWCRFCFFKKMTLLPYRCVCQVAECSNVQLHYGIVSDPMSRFKANRAPLVRLERRLAKMKYLISSKDQLNQALHEQWSKIKADICEILVKSVPQRCRAVIKLVVDTSRTNFSLF